MDKDKGQRRVYVLPNELVERIVAYQEEMGIQSEVEAARRLLDEALKRRDNWESLTRRFQERLKESKLLSDIAKDILMGHPLVSVIKIEENAIAFELTTSENVRISDNGEALANDRFNRNWLIKPNGEKEEDPLPF